MKLTKIISEIRNPKEQPSDYEIMVKLLPKIQKIFPDARLFFKEYPIGKRTEIRFTINKDCYATRRFGTKWKIDYFAGYLFYMENVPQSKEFWPDYSTTFPQAENLLTFFHKIRDFLKANYIKGDADLFNEIKQINPVQLKKTAMTDEDNYWLEFDDQVYELKYKDWLNGYGIEFNISNGKAWQRFRKLRNYLNKKDIPYDVYESRHLGRITIPKQYTQIIK